MKPIELTCAMLARMCGNRGAAIGIKTSISLDNTVCPADYVQMGGVTCPHERRCREVKEDDWRIFIKKYTSQQ